MWLVVLFLAVPLIEIALFIQIGGWIGLWPTLAVVVLTAVLGTWLVRREGMRALAELRQSFETLGDPAAPLAHGAAILFAGALLLTPGFFTDTVGFLLLVPAVRAALFRHLGQRIRVERFSYGTGGSTVGEGMRNPGSGQVVDGEWEEVSPARQPTHRPSGWTRH